MSLLAKYKASAATLVAATAAVAVAGLLLASAAHTEDLKSYDSSKKDFWLHPPDDWFMGDETKEQKGTHVLNTLPPPTGFTDEEIINLVAKLETVAALNPSNSSDLMLQAAAVITELLIKKRVHEEINKQRKPS